MHSEIFAIVEKNSSPPLNSVFRATDGIAMIVIYCNFLFLFYHLMPRPGIELTAELHFVKVVFFIAELRGCGKIKKLKIFHWFFLKVERAWAWAQRPGPSIRLTENKPRIEAQRPLFQKSLKQA